MPNQLITEKSPYLLQHANNPVDWYPWSDKAFEKAEKEDKPVFLSIGYSTCHWCHVMEKESFEDHEVAELMNDAFVSIKVDREERPDIDGIYMTVCQMLTGSGGWPLTIIMTPQKKPFFAGTYIPKNNRYGRSGMTDIIPKIKDVWFKRRQDVQKSADEITNALSNTSPGKQEEIDKYILDRAFHEFNRRYDKEFGGFNNAPKFPTPHNFYFLLRYWKKSGNNDAREMTVKTLTEMRKGGIYDHIGFGFHRYSTDVQWLVPHFEKMLYDQALLIIAYTEAWLATKDDLFKRTAEEIIEYVLRDMTSPEGAFYSAEDADSDGVEGKFYLWTEEELIAILKEDAPIALRYFNVSKSGNWTDPVHGSEDGTNILHLTSPSIEIASEFNMSVDELNAKVNQIRQILFNHREKRIHPYKDDKVLTDWNSLMISALARAAQAFNNADYAAAAEKGAKFIFEKLIADTGRLLHRYRDGEAGLPAHIDDYAFFMWALIDLYETTFNPYYLEHALRLNDDMIKYFRDEHDKAFFFTASDSEELISRQKEIYDGAVPSGNSAAMLNFVRLSRLTGNTRYEDDANNIIKAFAALLNSSPSVFSLALTGLSFIIGASYEIVIAGEKQNQATSEILQFLRQSFTPNKVILQKDNENSESLNRIAPFVVDYNNPVGKTLVFVCQNFQCNLPVTTVEELKQIIK